MTSQKKKDSNGISRMIVWDQLLIMHAIDKADGYASLSRTYQIGYTHAILSSLCVAVHSEKCTSSRRSISTRAVAPG